MCSFVIREIGVAGFIPGDSLSLCWLQVTDNFLFCLFDGIERPP